jgi:hypothetical protein
MLVVSVGLPRMYLGRCEMCFREGGIFQHQCLSSGICD